MSSLARAVPRTSSSLFYSGLSDGNVIDHRLIDELIDRGLDGGLIYHLSITQIGAFWHMSHSELITVLTLANFD